jgi:hypothetical protein
MSTILVPLDEQTVALAFSAKRYSEESLDAVIRRRFMPCHTAAAELPPGPKTQIPSSPYKITLLGESVEADSLGRLLQAAITRLTQLDGDCLERIARVSWRSRPVIAKQPEALYPTSPHLRRCALPLPGGWYVGTNVSRVDTKRYLKAVCAVLGLSYGADLAVDL